MFVSIGHASLDRVRTPEGVAEKQIGGAAVYAGVAATTLMDSGVVARIGTDFDAVSLEKIKQAGVDVTGLKKTSGLSSRFDIEYDENFEAHYSYSNPGAGSKLTKKDIPGEYLEKATVFHLAPMAPIKQINFLKHLGEESDGSLKSVNTHLSYIKKYRNQFPKLIKMSDIFILNESEAIALTGALRTDHATRIMAKFKDTLVIITLGSLGSAIMHNGEVQFAPSVYNSSPRDPTGAGDSFCGAFMASYEQTQDPIKSAIVGNAIASLKSEDRSFNSLINLRFKNISRIWDYFMSRTHCNGPQKTIMDYFRKH